jgi:multidrug efflux system membrane fusion protein
MTTPTKKWLPLTILHLGLLPLAVLSGLLSGVSGCAPRSDADARSPEGKGSAMAIPVEVERLEATEHQQAVTAVATVQPWRRVTLRAEVAARVTALAADVGEQVRAGQWLARLDSGVSRRSYQTTRVSIRQAQVSLDKARLDLSRAKKLHARGTYTQAQLDQAQSAYDGAAAALALAKAQTDQAGHQLSRYRLSAPFAGVISGRSVELGDYASPGASIYTLIDRRKLKLVVGLDPAVAALLRPGVVATATVKHGEEEHRLPARVHLVRPEVDPATRRQEVELSLDATEHLRPGLVAKARIPVGAARRRLLVPGEAVVELAGKHHVYVVREGKAVRLPVALGLSTAHRVEILPGGAKPARGGEPVVVAGVQRLSPGVPVEVVRSPTQRGK